jgi:hypothetical protein
MSDRAQTMPEISPVVMIVGTPQVDGALSISIYRFIMHL